MINLFCKDGFKTRLYTGNLFLGITPELVGWKK